MEAVADTDKIVRCMTLPVPSAGKRLKCRFLPLKDGMFTAEIASARWALDAMIADEDSDLDNP